MKDILTKIKTFFLNIVNAFKNLQLKCHLMGILVLMLVGLVTIVPVDFGYLRVQDSAIALVYHIMLFVLGFIFIMLIVNPNIKLHFLRELFVLATILNVVTFIYYFPLGQGIEFWLDSGIIINLVGVIWNLIIYYQVIIKKAVTFDEYGKKE